MNITQEIVNPSALNSLDFLWLEITHKCNLRCVHCYASSTPTLPMLGKMTNEDWETALTDAYGLGCRFVQFIGGEPTLHPHLPALIEHAKSTGFEIIEVYTNGTTFNDRLLKLFKKNEVDLAFSLYANQHAGHDNITQQVGSFEKAIQSIRTSLENNLKVRVGIVSVMSDDEKLQETIDFVKKLGVETITVDRVRGIGRDEHLNPGQEVFQELCGSCWMGKLCINPDGDVLPCVFSSFYPIGNVKEGLFHILSKRELRIFREKVAEMSNPTPIKPCDPQTCAPATKPCSPSCAPSCSPCIPDIRK